MMEFRVIYFSENNNIIRQFTWSSPVPIFLMPSIGDIVAIGLKSYIVRARIWEIDPLITVVMIHLDLNRL